MTCTSGGAAGATLCHAPSPGPLSYRPVGSDEDGAAYQVPDGPRASETLYQYGTVARVDACPVRRSNDVTPPGKGAAPGHNPMYATSPSRIGTACAMRP